MIIPFKAAKDCCSAVVILDAPVNTEDWLSFCVKGLIPSYNVAAYN